MDLSELKKELPKEQKRAESLRAFATKNPDMGEGWLMAATSAENNVALMIRLIDEKSTPLPSR